jgi:uncharacterized protein YndB with AHSA1/START domain
MNQDLTVTGSIDIDATAERVWEVMTNPDIIKEYLFGTETVTDWQVGSEVVFKGQFGEFSYRDHGIVLENLPLQKLSYSYWSGFSGLDDKPENYSMVTYLISKKADKLTNLTWVQKGYATEDGYKHSRDGMDAFMEQIKAIAVR